MLRYNFNFGLGFEKKKLKISRGFIYYGRIGKWERDPDTLNKTKCGDNSALVIWKPYVSFSKSRLHWCECLSTLFSTSFQPIFHHMQLFNLQCKHATANPSQSTWNSNTKFLADRIRSNWSNKSYHLTEHFKRVARVIEFYYPDRFKLLTGLTMPFSLPINLVMWSDW